MGESRALRAAELAAMIDLTLLKADATAADVDRLCDQALQHRCAAVCINPARVERAAGRLAGSTVGVATVVGFPLGATPGSVKAYEAVEAISAGATEIDMVISIGSLKDGRDDVVAREVELVVQAASRLDAIVKVIVEACYLDRDEKARACRIAVDSGAAFVKTSTGFGPGGATEEDVRLMRGVVGDRAGVKAAGGIRTLDDAVRMVRAGATRLGTSSGVAILEEAKRVRAGDGEEA